MNTIKFKQTTCAVFFFSLLTICSSQIAKKITSNTDVVVDTQTALKKWELMESQLKDLVQKPIKLLLPWTMEATQSLNISAPCIRDVLKVVSGLKRLKVWAFKFLDASSKSVDGLLDGVKASLGNYDECIENQVFDERSETREKVVLFRGKYCRVEVTPYLPPRPKKIYIPQTLSVLKNFTDKDTVIGSMARLAHLSYHGSIILGVCVPSGCSKDDVNEVLSKVTDYAGVVIKSPNCETKKDRKFTPLMVAIITVYSLTVLLLIIGSATDWYGIHKKKNFKSTSVRILTSFSFISNFRKFIDMSTPSGTFSCLNSIRTLTMTWIIHGHSVFAFTFTLHRMRNVFDIVEDLPFQSIMSSPLGVETFFFITGTLVCYNVIKLVKVGKKSLNPLMYIFHRIWRIYPAYLYAIAFMFLLPLMASGPEFHSITEREIRSCEKNWWASILFINNFYDPGNMCYSTGWYLTMDMQLHVGALIILLLLMRKPKLGITVTVIIIIASMVGSWWSIYMNDLMPKNGFTADTVLAVNTFRYSYIMPHTHSGPYCIGILCGYLLAVKPNLKIPKVIQIMGWSVATVTSLSLIYGVPKWNGFVEPTFVETLLFSMFYRTGWALCVGWVVICCCTGHGGIVNYILSWKIWIPIGRLTFVAYLIHPLVIMLHTASVKTEAEIDFPTDVYNFFGTVVITYLCAFGGSMLIETPFMSLEKILFSKVPNQKPPTDCQNKEESVHASVYSIEPCVKENGAEIDAGFNNTSFVYKT